MGYTLHLQTMTHLQRGKQLFINPYVARVLGKTVGFCSNAPASPIFLLADRNMLFGILNTNTHSFSEEEKLF
jgi:hypothetical protein